MNRLPQEITTWCDELAQTEIYQERITRPLDPCFPVTSTDILKRFPSFEDFCKRAEVEIEQENRRKSQQTENKSLDETIVIEDEPVENRIEKDENMEVDKIITKTGAKDLNQNEAHEKSSEPEKIENIEDEMLASYATPFALAKKRKSPIKSSRKAFVRHSSSRLAIAKAEKVSILEE